MTSRPERPDFVRRFLKELPGYGIRYQLWPSLTGMAQAYGRYDSEPEQKLVYDLYYIAHRSLWLDLKLFLKSWANTARLRCDVPGKAARAAESRYSSA